MFFETPKVDRINMPRAERELDAGRPDTSFFDVLGKSDLAAQSADATNARILAEEHAIDQRNDRIKATFGKDLPNPFRQHMPTPEERINGGENPWTLYWKQVQELAEQNPEHAEWIAANRRGSGDAAHFAQHADREHMRALQDYDHWTGSIASFAGAMWSIRKDPLNLAAMTIGFNGARTGLQGLLWAAAKNGGVNAGIELAQAPLVQQWRKDAGLTYGADHVAMNVTAAALFGFGLDAGARSITRGVQTARGRVAYVDEKGHIAGWKRPEDPDPVIISRAEHKKIEQGDVETIRTVAKRLKIDDDPSLKGAIHAAEDEATLLKSAKENGIDIGENMNTFHQVLRATLDDSEPLPVVRAPKSDAEEVATLATPEQSRSGAEINADRKIVSDKATPIVEAAVAARRSPQLFESVINPTTTRLKAIDHLSRLSDEAFTAVEAGQAPARYAALVGEYVPDPVKHMPVLDRLTELEPKSIPEARRIIGDELQKDTGAQVQSAVLGGAPVSRGTNEVKGISEVNGPEGKAQIDALTAEIGHGRTIDDAIDAFREAVERVSPMLPDGVRVSMGNAHGKMAAFDGDLIEISWAAVDPERYLRHEAVHALKKVGAFDNTEWRMLVDLAEREGVLEQRMGGTDKTLGQEYRELYDGYHNADEIIKEEAVANLIEQYRKGQRFGTDLDGILGRIVEFVQRVGNALRSRGFQTADDVIDRLMSGEIKQRTMPEPPAREAPLPEFTARMNEFGIDAAEIKAAGFGRRVSNMDVELKADLDDGPGTVRMPAPEAIKMIDQRLEGMGRLMDCLSK